MLRVKFEGNDWYVGEVLSVSAEQDDVDGNALSRVITVEIYFFRW